jgi:hypothetical protein
MGFRPSGLPGALWQTCTLKVHQESFSFTRKIDRLRPSRLGAGLGQILPVHQVLIRGLPTLDFWRWPPRAGFGDTGRFGGALMNRRSEPHGFSPGPRNFKQASSRFMPRGYFRWNWRRKNRR